MPNFLPFTTDLTRLFPAIAIKGLIRTKPVVEPALRAGSTTNYGFYLLNPCYTLPPAFSSSKPKVVQWMFVGGVLLFWVGLMGTIALGWVSPAIAANYERALLQNADFAGKVLTDASFNRANLTNSDFNHANLRGVSFFGANLESANLEAADLSFATLDNARLVRTNLKDAVLEGAFAFNARFTGANIEGADFTDILLQQDVLDALCDRAQGINPTTGRATRDTLNCY